jgi:hypothetical protein
MQRKFAEGIHAKFPECWRPGVFSLFFNWAAKLSVAEMERLEDLAAMGYTSIYYFGWIPCFKYKYVRIILKLTRTRNELFPLQEENLLYNNTVLKR